MVDHATLYFLSVCRCIEYRGTSAAEIPVVVNISLEVNEKEKAQLIMVQRNVLTDTGDSFHQ